MKNISLIDSEPVIALKDIENLELLLNVKLPEDYKQFLLIHNGGHPIKDMYPIIQIFDFHRYGWGDSEVYDCEISSFSAICNSEYNNLFRENLNKIDIPDEFFIIACSSIGDSICIRIKEENFGKLYYYGHDWDVENGSISYILIANTFTDFINSLYSFDIEGEMSKEGVYKVKKRLYTHDKYSIGFSTEAKKYGSIVTDFFAKASSEVEDYVIEQKEGDEDILLYYDFNGKRYNRLIKSSGEATDYVTDIEKKNEKS